jgi:hypothetical protein
MQLSRNEHLTSLEVSQGSQLRRDSLQNPCAQLNADITLVIDNQQLTFVGTPPAHSIAASWHGASERTITIKRLKK